MEIKITGEPKEIAALVFELQERRDENEDIKSWEYSNVSRRLSTCYAEDEKAKCSD